MSAINGQLPTSHDQLMQEVSVSIARKSLDVAEAQGDAAIKLLESAAQLQKKSSPAAGNGHGRSSASPAGIGTLLDVIA